MKGVAMVLVAATAGLVSSAAAGAASTQPPMGQFEGAYYTCDQGQAFAVTYDSKDPKTADITTSNNNTRYSLKRAPAADGAQFSNGTVTISVSGNQATVAGTQIKLTGCKLKTTT